jgi:type III secretory pathway lipoprotein EscJ
MERATTPSASVLVVHRTTTAPIDERSVRMLVAGACEGMRPEHVSVLFARRAPRAPRSATLAYVGPLAVAPASASTLRVLLAAMFAAITAAVAFALRLRARVIR